MVPSFPKAAGERAALAGYPQCLLPATPHFGSPVLPRPSLWPLLLAGVLLFSCGHFEVPHCGPDNCHGCCSAEGICEAGATDTCGEASQSDAGLAPDGGTSADAGDVPDAGACLGSLSHCGTACVDLKTSDEHCGACDHPCSSTEACEQGSCASLPPDCTQPGASCPQTHYCDLGSRACKPGCAADSQCPDGARCDLAAHQCACPSNQNVCDHQCVPQAVEHCGASCSVCTAPANAIPSCTRGACAFSCEAGFHLCGTQCLSDSSVDSCGSRCGACGTLPNQTPSCEAGVCMNSCNPGTHACAAGCCAWVTQTVDSIGGTGGYPSLALDGEGKPRIAYSSGKDGNGDVFLKYASWTGSTWAIQSIAPAKAINGSGTWCSLKLNAAGAPRIAFSHRFLGGFLGADLKYAAWYASGGWGTSTVRPMSASGRMSLVLSPDDTASIGFEMYETSVKKSYPTRVQEFVGGWSELPITPRWAPMKLAQAARHWSRSTE